MFIWGVIEFLRDLFSNIMLCTTWALFLKQLPWIPVFTGLFENKFYFHAELKRLKVQAAVLLVTVCLIVQAGRVELTWAREHGAALGHRLHLSGQHLHSSRREPPARLLSPPFSAAVFLPPSIHKMVILQFLSSCPVDPNFLESLALLAQLALLPFYLPVLPSQRWAWRRPVAGHLMHSQCAWQLPHFPASLMQHSQCFHAPRWHMSKINQK